MIEHKAILLVPFFFLYFNFSPRYNLYYQDFLYLCCE